MKGGKMKRINFVVFFNLFLLILFPISAESQYYKLYETDQYGIKEVTPSIIIDEDTVSGNFEVYTLDKLGLKQIFPDEIIENKSFFGCWEVYRVNNFGIKDINPQQIIESDTDNNHINIFNTNSLGLKNINPSSILEKDINSGDIKIYNVNTYGMKYSIPVEIIKKEGSCYNVYSTNNLGLPQVFPKRVIEIQENRPVFGILLFPTVKTTIFNQNNPKIKNIRRLKNLNRKEWGKSGWIRS
ncbi:hypothetical protein HNV12_19235 [Methanococcoides sp. SA1]|nr:hypothetical protein [Methanococcoides sp. SA1]